MQLLKCPHCGAPPPSPINFAGQTTYQCPYCRHQSVVGAPAEPQPPTHGPTFIVINGSPHDDDGEEEIRRVEREVHRQEAVHTAAARSFSWIIWLVIVLVVSLGGAGAGFARCTKRNALLSSLVWDGSEPLHCTGIEQIAVSGVQATFTSGSAIVASGNCQVRCTDCKIEAPTAIEASANAQVTIVNGSIKGTNLLADASGNARVDIAGNVVASGKVKESANARVVAPPSVSAAAAALSAAAVPALTAPSSPTKPTAGPLAKPAKTVVKPKASK